MPDCTLAGPCTGAADARRERFAAAMRGAVCDDPDLMTGGEEQVISDLADAVMAVADEEQQELVTRLGQYADRAIANGEETARLRAELEQARTSGQHADPALLTELTEHIAEYTPGCNARVDHLMSRAAWALGAPRPEHIGGNAEDCPGCGGSNPPYPFLCPRTLLPETNGVEK
ncbi:hypothetical protein [Streptomyces sp. NPDC055036]